MASGAYVHGIRQALDGTYNITSATLKMMLVESAYVFDKTHTVVDDGTTTSTCLHHNELVATNYTGGFGGAGRKTATIAISEDGTNTRVVLTFTSITWTALGGATNDTVAAAALIRESGNDTTSVPIAYFDITDTPTNGSDFTLTMATSGAGGNMRFTC